MSFGVPLSIGTSAGAAVGALDFTISDGTSLEDLPADIRDYAYLGRARQELEAE